MNQNSLLPAIMKLQKFQERVDEAYGILSHLTHEIRIYGNGNLANMSPEAIKEVGDAIKEVAGELGQYISN